jgi:DNA mismatch endonuclease (patch repair protein)
MDNLTKTQRSYTMSKIRSTETQQEKKLRSSLYRKGFRFKKNVGKLPGKPDIVLPQFKTVIFVNGCFWHQHPGCLRAVMPKSNRNYWKLKLKKNMNRDKKNIRDLGTLKWRVITVWECEIKDDIEKVASRIENKLLSMSI